MHGAIPSSKYIVWIYTEKEDRNSRTLSAIGSQMIFLFALSCIFYLEQVLPLQSEKSMCVLLKQQQFGFSNLIILFIKGQSKQYPHQRTVAIGFLAHDLFLALASPDHMTELTQ